MRRFTYKASDATQSLEHIQKRLALARKRVRELEAEERELKGYLIPYFDDDEVVDLEFTDGTVMRIKRSEYDMFTIDEDRVKAVFSKLRKPVPYKKTVVQKLTVRRLLSNRK
jgi:hypothetical protein